ncbi:MULTISPECIES: hypothetical protein [Streptomyces]|jgi:hypothetical protein|uniref:Uncharacterized protein n=1 Tax=Streptomyces nymphaeiformis TaxID=2663842 RepID=A0A7W7XC01_9ACTN|nr:hypothetical protein [Streptomyces nymphaeiformis]MBB4982550.1 hypothetical protein [Streptomyces nymphaeiformis]
MAHNPQAPYGQGQPPQGPEGYDPAGSTQMFRAFVDEGTPQRQQPQAVAASGGPRVGLIVGVVAVIAVLAVAAWLALG